MTSISTKEMSQQEWVNIRKESIGGSDVAVILGCNPYKSQFELWQEKTGRMEPEDLSQNVHVLFGKRMEPVIAEWFQEMYPEYEVIVDENIHLHEKYPFIAGNFDRKLVDEFGIEGILEIKTTTAQTFKKWQDGINSVLCSAFSVDKMYYAQIQHYLSISGAKYGVFAIMVDKSLKVTHVARDENWIRESTEIVAEWWKKHIEGDTPPPMIIDDYRLIEPQQGSQKQAGEETVKMWEDLLELKGRKKQLDEEIKILENGIKFIMMDNEALVLGDEVLATWKSQTSNRFDTTKFKKEEPDVYKQYTKQSITRVFRVKGETE